MNFTTKRKRNLAKFTYFYCQAAGYLRKMQNIIYCMFSCIVYINQQDRMNKTSCYRRGDPSLAWSLDSSLDTDPRLDLTPSTGRMPTRTWTRFWI